MIQSFPVWLPRTQTWMFHQVKFLPPGVEAHVVCERTENLDQFRVANLHALSEAGICERIWDYGLKRSGARCHLGFLVRQAKKHRARVLHSHFGPVGWEDLEAARKAGLRHVVTFYGFDVGQLPSTDGRWRSRYLELFRAADRVLCEGPHMGRRLEGLGCPAEKIRIQRLGIPVEDIISFPRRWRRGEPLRVLIAASFVEKKGIPDALEALAVLREEVPLEVAVIGDENGEDHSRREKQKILEVIERRGLGSNVRLLGFQPYSTLLAEAYKHHIFLSPSRTAGDGDTEGGAPVTLIEMAATGLPVVSTRHCDIPEIVKDGVTGFLADEHDVPGLVGALRRMVAGVDQWGAMAEAAHEHLKREFDAVKQGERLAAIYREIVS